MAQPKKAAPDWERIEADYRAGLLSVREIAASQGITDGAIRKRAKRDEWSRDLSKRILDKADTLVRSALVRSAVRTPGGESGCVPTTIPDKAIVDAGAEMVASVRLSQRRDVGRARALTMALLAEVEQQTADPELFERIGELVLDTGGDAESKLLEAYRRVLSTPGRIDGVKKLAETLKHLIGLEREAYGISDASSSTPAAAVAIQNNTTVVIQDAVSAAIRELDTEY